MITITFVTHSTSVDNERRQASGHADIDLSEVGVEQATEMGQRYAGHAIAAVFCSDLRRASRTAQIAFGGRNIPIIQDARLRECDYGSLTQHPTDDVEASRAKYVEEPFPGGESYRQVVEHVRDFLDHELRAFDGQHMIIVGHRGTYFSLEHLLKGTPLAEAVTAPFAWEPGWSYEFTPTG